MSSNSDIDNGATDAMINSNANGYVWYEIASQGGTSSKLYVEVTSGEVVSSMLMKIKNSNMNTIGTVDVNQLEVYTNQKNKVVLDRAETWSPATKWGNAKVPLLVTVSQLNIARQGMIEFCR
jgi:hypothetical protein